jgi:hypothetical protein
MKLYAEVEVNFQKPLHSVLDKATDSGQPHFRNVCENFQKTMSDDSSAQLNKPELDAHKKEQTLR